MLGFQLVLAVVFGVAGYWEAAKFEREHGHGPFGIPKLGWGFITGASLVIGAVLLAVARRQAKNAPARAPLQAPAVAAPSAVFGSSFDWTGAPAAPPREDLWAAPAPVPTQQFAPAAPVPTQQPAPVPVPTQQPAPAPFVSSAAARDILPGR
jgi:hypothetical protein